MEQMYLRLELNHPLTTRNTVYKTIPIDSENVNLIDCIKSVEGMDCRISFGRYYGNTNLMNFENVFPYIITDGTIKWYVPFSDVTIRDFRNTHSIDQDEVVHVEIDAFGGGWDEVSELILWIASNWDAINSDLGNVSSLITIAGFIRKIYKYFANKRNRLPDFRDVKEVVEKQDTWESNLLMNLLKVDDDELMDCLSHSIGYKKYGTTYIKEPAENEIISTWNNADSIWGVQTCSRWTADITREIHRLNLLLTDLKFRSENLELEWFHDVDDRVNKLIDKWKYYLVHGENLCFVKIIDSPRNYDHKDIERDINTLDTEVQKLLDRIEELEGEKVTTC